MAIPHDHDDATPVAATAVVESPQDKKKRQLGLILCALGAVGLWAGARMEWVTVNADDDKLGRLTRTLVGAAWSPELTAAALGVAAAIVAMLVVRPFPRRIIAGITAVIGALVGITPMLFLTSDVDAARARDILVSGQATQKSTDPVQLSQWAAVQEVTAHTTGPALAVAGAALVIVGALLVLLKPGVAATRTDRFDTQSKKEEITQDLAAAPTSERLMWDALDVDVDPTDDTPDEQSRRR